MTRTRWIGLLLALGCSYALALTVPEARERGAHGASASGARADTRMSAASAPAQVAVSAGVRKPANSEASAHAISPSALSAAPLPASVELYVSAYEQALAREAPDRDWQRHVADALDALLASAELAGTQLQAQRCGATLCRVDLRYDSLQARERAEEALPQREPFDAEGLIHSSSDGLQVSVYFSRRGYPLPEVELPSAAL